MLTVGVYGATGQVGAVMRAVLDARHFPQDRLRLFASSRSAGRVIDGVAVEDVATADHRGVDVALFSMGAGASRQFGERVAAAGAIVIDNSSAWRMDPDCPLVVPEVNAAALDRIPKGIVANPNCTTMVAMPVLAPIACRGRPERLRGVDLPGGLGGRPGRHRRAGGPDAGRGRQGRRPGLRRQRPGVPAGVGVSRGPIAFNVLPHAGTFEGDETTEELKFRNESRKILGIPDLARVGDLRPRPGVYRPLAGPDRHLRASRWRPTGPSSCSTGPPGVEVVDVPTPLQCRGS